MKILYVNNFSGSDLSLLLERSGAECTVVGQAELTEIDFDEFDGSGESGGMMFKPTEHMVADEIKNALRVEFNHARSAFNLFHREATP